MTIISRNKTLKCLEDTLINDEERKTVTTWARDAERIKTSDEKENSRLGMIDFRRMQREAALQGRKEDKRYA